MKPKHIQHLYWRAGFGIAPDDLQKMRDKSRAEIVEDLIYQSRRSEPLYIDHSDYKRIDPKSLMGDKAALRKAIQDSGKKLKELNSAWIERLSNSNSVLREKMTLFWANHFVCRDTNSYFMELYNNMLRENALGNMRSFTKAVSRQAAMIKYLNLKQNRWQNPNENFARELMELFLLGTDNYTEEDIKESARAFTGYDHNFKGEFLLRKRRHDYDNKTFFGRTDKFTGDDIIDIILVERKCARFVCQKVYRYFVSDTVNQDHIDEMVTNFYPKYDIENLMRFVFMADWFYEENIIGCKIKSPIEFLLGLNTLVPMQYQNRQQLLGLQKALGQVLLFPPNVAGWEGGKQWIDSNTILMRMRLPSVLLNGAEISAKQAGDFQDRFGSKMRKAKNNPFNVKGDWDAFERKFSNVSIDNLHDFVLQSELNSGTDDLLKKLSQETKRDYAIQLMSLPEYQMC